MVVKSITLILLLLVWKLRFQRPKNLEFTNLEPKLVQIPSTMIRGNSSPVIQISHRLSPIV